MAIKKDVSLITPANTWAAVSPSDSTDLTSRPRALYIGVSGDVVIKGDDGTSGTFKSVPIGILSCRAARVMATGTTATNILALY